ncbi:MAG: SMI1/KNR4 family protein, partial [Bacteroidia bacterium]|nr:SMI1/KNR4 family protein [Bacteroidia bacterium]
MTIKIQSSNPPVTESILAQFEELLNTHLPSEYRDFLLECNGGVPFENTCNVVVGEHKTLYFFVVKNFLGINSQNKHDLIATYKLFKTKYGGNWLPIAFDQFGNGLMLSLQFEQ